MRVLLTGIGGSIGIHTFAHIMHNTDWHVVGIDSFRHKGWPDRITEVLKDHPDWVDRLTMITHDLTAPITELTSSKIGHLDYIISMAALSDVFDSLENPVPFVRNNVDIALNMLEFAKECDSLKAFVQVSTDEVYGPADRNHGHPEWSPIVPSNPYSASKAAQEALVIAWWRSYGVPVIITNTMNNFGEMQQANKFPVIVQKAVDTWRRVLIHGEPGNIGTRYYLHSRNHADALLWLLRNTVPTAHVPGAIDKPDRWNIIGDIQLDNLELAQKIAELMRGELRYCLVGMSDERPGHDSHYGLDGTKLKEAGWKSPVPFEESLKNTIQWQQEHKEWL